MLPSERATKVVKERQGQYGHPTQVYEHVARLWDDYLFAVRKRKNPLLMPKDVAMMLLLLKVGRQMNKPFADNLTDICGYANVLEMMQNG